MERDRTSIERVRRLVLKTVLYDETIPDRTIEEQKPGYDQVVATVCRMCPNRESIFPALVRVLREVEPYILMAEEKDFSKTHSAQRQYELRRDVMTDAAKKAGLEEYDIARAHYIVEDQVGRQTLFDIHRDNGFQRFSYHEVGQLMNEFGLEWELPLA